MTVYRTYLSVLENGAASWPDSPALKVPQYSQDGLSFQGWEDITYKRFKSDVETAGHYWLHELSQRGWNSRSVVGLWLKGTSYVDLLHIWGVLRAGYIPQLISLRMTSPEVVYELLDRAGAVALIHEPSFGDRLENSPLPSLPAGDSFVVQSQSLTLPKLWTASNSEDVTMILHTSGSSSGIPKLVPYTAKYLDFAIQKLKSFQSWPLEGQQEVISGGGSFCHLAAMAILVSYLDRGGAMILPTQIPYPSSELRHMVKEGGLTALFMFSSFLHKLLHEARDDKSLVQLLQDMRHVSYGGLPLDTADEEWGRAQGMNFVNVFASTEVGLMAQTPGKGPDEEFLQPFPGTGYEFVPLSGDDDQENFVDGKQLLELVIPPSSPDCPSPSLRSEKDGKYHTGDLFIEAKPGKYVSKGRNDDWIKMEISLRCDTRSIEENALEMCGKDLISQASVVGSGRPSPVLIVEPAEGVKIGNELDDRKLKDEILRRVQPFHERRYLHERIDSTNFILVVPQGALPRTASKGNVQRKMVEKVFEGELNKVY